MGRSHGDVGLRSLREHSLLWRIGDRVAVKDIWHSHSSEGNRTYKEKLLNKLGTKIVTAASKWFKHYFCSETYDNQQQVKNTGNRHEEN